MCVRKDILIKYGELYHLNGFKTTGVTGTSLMGAAEDIQIVYTSILMGLAVGICPELKLTHIIPSKRSNFLYIKNLRFFNRYASIFADVEFFPDKLKHYKDQQRSQLSLFIQLNKYLLKGILSTKIRESIIDCVLISGNYAGINLVLNRENPFWLKLFWEIIGIKIN